MKQHEKVQEGDASGNSGSSLFPPPIPPSSVVPPPSHEESVPSPSSDDALVAPVTTNLSWAVKNIKLLEFLDFDPLTWDRFHTELLQRFSGLDIHNPYK